jgi:predicted dehydrogenase
LNIALIGAGRMGRRHIAAIQLLRHHVFGVVDYSPETLELAQKENGILSEVCHSNSANMYARGIPDAVVVATTADYHHSLVIEAARLGVKYILVEKPMAVSVQQCQEMIQVCKAEGAYLSVNHQMRFMEQYCLTKKKCEQEDLGGFCSMNVIAGNMGLAMNCSHFFEAFRYITGEKILSVNAWLSRYDLPNPRGPQFRDKSGVVRAHTQSGKRLFIDCGADQGNGIFVVYGCRQGQIRLDELSGEYSVMHRKREDRELPTTRYGMPSHYFGSKIKGAEVVESSAQVLDALIKQKEPVTGEDGLHSLKVLAACYRSNAHNGAEVLVDDLDQDGTVFPWA